MRLIASLLLCSCATGACLTGTLRGTRVHVNVGGSSFEYAATTSLGFSPRSVQDSLAACTMAFSVVQRRRELTVRAALGAQRRQLSGLVLARGARLALLGIPVGLFGALALSRFLSALLYGIGERHPLTFTVVAVMPGTVALAACLLPASAAARLDPMTVLRGE